MSQASARPRRARIIAVCLGVGAFASAVSAGGGCGERFQSGVTTTGGGGPTTTSSATSVGGAGGDGAAGSGGAGAEPAGGQGGTAALPCATSGFEEDFGGDGWQQRWEPWFNEAARGTADVAEGIAFVELPASADEVTACAGLWTLRSYDLRDCATWIEMVQTLPTSVPGAVYFGIWADSSPYSLWCGNEAGQLHCWLELGDEPVPGNETFLQFDATTHRWWRIREDGGHTLVETSADGLDYTARLEFDSNPLLEDATVMFFACTWGPTESVSRAEFDNANIVPSD
jgi:hypothetical protein